MVQRYTEQELLSYEAGACLPDGVDLTPFLTLVETVSELLRQIDEANPRRRSFSHYKALRKNKTKEVVDEDGWTSFVTEKNPDSENIDGESAIDGDDVNENVDGFEKPNSKKGKQHTIKIKTNASKISSGKSSSANGDTVAITETSKFNAFDALALDDDDE
ncbi:hypothetical protein DAPK24_031700 [Pichia kluyveri]|uniref:Cap-associated protein CAF20 n=1 Tax=Pichia kluyveri TaxID=36015 RepID=A0AAV5R5N4_PICKL|nr:hypothetical protein DAPK24_031700 [Pichia kluyveri]